MADMRNWSWQDAQDTIDLIMAGVYNAHRPSGDVVRELVSVIRLMEERIRELEGR